MTAKAEQATLRHPRPRSTGPRTAAGKRKSAQNARRHGLTCAQAPDPQSDPEVLQLADLLSAERKELYALAFELAQQLKRREQVQRAAEYEFAQAVRQVRALNADLPIEIIEDVAYVMIARKLMSLDRYEQRARTRIRKLMRRL